MKPLAISTGRAADGKDTYFGRQNIEEKIWAKIGQKEDLLLAAPRRTGKSSILKYLERNPRDGYSVKYKSVQSVDSINEYFKQIYKLLLEDDSIFSVYEQNFNKAKGAVKSFISRIRGISIDGIEINPEEHVDYVHECESLLKTLPPDFDTLLFLIDEFPDAVKNIARDNEKEGIRFLQLNRDLRQELDGVNLQFVYTGSIGLGNVVSTFNRIDLINDLVNIEVPPLTLHEAKELIRGLVAGLQQEKPDFEISDQLIDSVLQKDSWLIPYYIQITIDEIFDLFLETSRPPTDSTVDEAINKIICDRYKYQDYFENWKTRLKQAFEKNEYHCAIEILNFISINGSMDYDTLCNVTAKHDIDDVKDITNVLEYDGYINKNPQKVYMFNSIILKEWWSINVAS